MGIKLSTTKTISGQRVENYSLAVDEVRIRQFQIKRPFASEGAQIEVTVEYALGTVANGVFTPVTLDTFSVTGNQARNFLSQTVNGPLGRSIESAVLAGLVQLGKLPQGTANDND